MKKFLCNIITLQNKNFIASDLNSDDVVNSSDLILLRKLLLTI
ncbi:MAG: hypothetical protein II357_01050 [Clostridia bacterium]|nr:hypothetical protein [Clostridia bacterium]